ncbi:PucR family transcriptional regulator [Pigmentiphaga soli]|uniref:PucR family transcriptional regulator n=1 Tax=Pigmentiphaga soli TaxID=1007095 RepID=A0ABP8HS99_9BURK
MDIASILQDTVLKEATLVAGRAAVSNEVRWVHIVDLPDIVDWVDAGQLLLTTGYHWPAAPARQSRLVEQLHAKGLAGVVLAVPNALPHFPAASRKAADRVGLPLLELPWEVPFSQITEQIHVRIIRDQGALIERSESIHRALTNAAASIESLQKLAAILADLLGRDVCFISHDGLLLGAADMGAARQAHERRYLREARARHGTLPPGAGNAPFWIEAMPERGFARRLGCPIVVHGGQAALVWLDDGPHPLGELDVRAAEHAAIVAALHLSHAEALRVQEERLGYTLLESLLDGSFKESEAALERARLRGWDPRAPYRVCLALHDETLPLSRPGFLRIEAWTERLRQALGARGVPAVLFASANQVHFLLPQDQSPEALWQAVRGKGVGMAVSRPGTGARGVAAAGADLQALLPLLAPGRLVPFEEVTLPRALMGDADARRMLIERRLGPLRAGAKNGFLFDTLAALADEGFHLAATAQRLGLHISSLRYRVGRIAALLGVDLEDPAQRFELQVALAMQRLEHDAAAPAGPRRVLAQEP